MRNIFTLLSLVILPLVLPSNYVVSGVKSLRFNPVFILNVMLHSILFRNTFIDGLPVTVGLSYVF